MKAVYRIILDVAHPDREHIVTLKQRDHKAREMEFTILNNGKAMDFSDVLYAIVKGVKPDNESVIFADAVIVTDEEGNNTNVVTYEIDDSIVEAPGKYTFALELLDSQSAVLSTFEFYVNVQNHLYDEDDYVTESDLSGFRSYMVRNLNATKKSEDITRKFNVAYGTVDEVVASLRATDEEYADMMADLEEKVRTGYFVGPRGPQGEKGSDGIVTDLQGLFCFEIVEENLVMWYGSNNPPDVFMDGCNLYWGFGGEPIPPVPIEPGGEAKWGGIKGQLDDQVDLRERLFDIDDTPATVQEVEQILYL